MLSAEDVRAYIRDSIPYNRLIDELEFKDEDIDRYREIGMAELNIIPPITNYELSSIPSSAKVLVLYAMLANMFVGRAAHAARNQMSYSDGGLTIPIEERYQYYLQLSSHFRDLFNTYAKNWKTGANIDGLLGGAGGNGAWGQVGSDYSLFPSW